MEKTYHALLADWIFLGGASDIPAMAEQEQLDVVVDLREEATGCAAPHAALIWQKIPLGDNTATSQAPLFQQAIAAVVTAYRQGQKVGFHCGGGKGRTGTVAAGVLLELGLCQTLTEAEAMAKRIRPVINIKPEQRQALAELYPAAAQDGDTVQ